MISANDKLDELDIRILEALQRNARSTFAELGALVGLKAPAVHDRVKHMEQSGHIRAYAAQLDGKRLGLELLAFVSLYATPDVDYEAFTSALREMPEVCEIHSVAGEETFVCKVVTRSTSHLDDLLSRLKSLRGMARTKTIIVLSTPFDRGGISVS